MLDKTFRVDSGTVDANDEDDEDDSEDDDDVFC